MIDSALAAEIRRLSETLARDPASLAFLRLGEALRVQRRLPRARAVAEAGVARHPELADAHALMGRVAADEGDLERAEGCWREVQRLAPGHLDAARGMAFVRWRQGRINEARELLEDARDACLHPDTRRSLTAALERLDAGPVEDRYHATPLEPATGVMPPRAPEPELRPAPAGVVEPLTALAGDARALSEALELGGWDAVLVECENGLLGVAPAGSMNGVPECLYAELMPTGLAIRSLLHRGASRGIGR